MTNVRILDIFLLFPSSLVAFPQILKWMGGEIKLPILDNIPSPINSILIVAMTFYWAARGVAILGKSWGDFIEKKHQNDLQKIKNDLQKIKNDRERRDEYVRKTAIYATKEQLDKISELEEKQLKEKEQFLKKIGVKKDTIIDKDHGTEL